MQIVLLSGRLRAGKSTLVRALQERYGARVVKTRDLIAKELPDEPLKTREDFQRAGDILDARTNGEWVASGLYAEIQREPADDRTLMVVDSVRIESQIEQIRKAFKRVVVHVHLSISAAAANARMQDAKKEFQEASSYDAAVVNETEANVEALAKLADIVINTERDRPDDVVVRVAGQLGLLYVSPSAYVDVLVGGQYGSEGKGHIAWHLAREYDYLVRVGGPNAGHKVPTIADPNDPKADDEPFTFHMLPSGTGETPGKVILGPGTTISLTRLQTELGELRLDEDRLIIDEQAMIIEPGDAKFEEKSIKRTIASTAQGGGYAAARRLMRGGLQPKRPVRLAKDIPELQPYVGRTADVLERAFSDGARVFVEGTQGSALSLFHGYYPYVTSRDTNIGGLLAETGIASARVRKVILVVRTYPIRVQDPDEADKTSGHMSQELTWEEVARRAELDPEELRKKERTSTTDRQRRVGEFDWVLLRRAVHLNAPTDIALTFADYSHKNNKDARRFEQLHPDTQRFATEIERVAGAPVSLISTGFSTHSIIDRRTW